MLIVAAHTVALAQSTDFPYQVKVASDYAAIRSGPGSVHYATEQLDQGAMVEIYRHDPGGWMAIRPPQGSFSLVQSDEVEALDDGLVRVRRDGARAWVGTSLSPVDQPMWQVQLKKGELLEVLGTVDRQRYQLDNEQPDWYQIAPPAGEFRWVHSDDLDLENPIAVSLEKEVEKDGIGVTEPSAAAQSKRETKPVSVSDSWDGDVSEPNSDRQLDRRALSDQRNKQFASETRSKSGAGWRPAARSINTFVELRSQFTADTSFGQNNISNWPSHAEIAAHDASVRSPIFDGSVSNQGSSQVTLASNQAYDSIEIQSLELGLTQELLRPPVEWNLMELARQAQQLRDQAASPHQVAGADRLLAKVRRCREIQAGYLAVDAQLPVVSASGSSQIQDRHTSGGIPTRFGTDLYRNYDAHGWLNELVRDGGVGPTTYVLQDSTGRITHHVAAPPGLNLRRYLNKEVGIVGNRGFHQRLNLDHVTAERVIDLATFRR